MRLKSRIAALPLVKAVLDLRGPYYRRRERMRYSGRAVLASQEGNAWLARAVESGCPAAVAKFGSVEFRVLEGHLRAGGGDPHLSEDAKKAIYVNAGVFPPTAEAVANYCETLAGCLGSVDGIGVYYHKGEAGVTRRYCAGAALMDPLGLEPYYHERPWTQTLAGKRLLVVHPFADSVERQFKRREDLWPEHPGVLPDFELVTLKVPLSDAVAKSPYPSWASALAEMQSRMASLAFDVAVIGAGAYSIPLAVHAKSLGKLGVHMGGATQILFGIKGARWDADPVISAFYNDAWCRPSDAETPPAVGKVEGGCYW